MKKMLIAVLGLALSTAALAEGNTRNITIVNKSSDYKMSVNYQVCTYDYSNSQESCDGTVNKVVKEADKSGKNWVSVTIPEDNRNGSVFHQVKILSASALDGKKVVIETSYPSNRCSAEYGAILLDDVKNLPFLICSQGDNS